MSQVFNAGSAIQTDGELAPDGTSIRPNMTMNQSSKALALERLNILVQLWVAEGADGDCPDELDTDLVAGNVLQ
jgi:hypothetical protein